MTTSTKLNTDNNLENKFIKFYLMPSLAHIASTSIIITLLKKADIKQEIGFYDQCDMLYYDLMKVNKFLKEFRSLRTQTLLQKIETKVLEWVLQLPIPDLIKNNLSYFVHPLNDEIMQWITYQDRHVFKNEFWDQQDLNPISINYIQYLVWTPRGKIDYKETAKTLLEKEESLSEENKYNIACTYCLEDKLTIYSKEIYSTHLEPLSRQAMVYFWTAHITGDFTELKKAIEFDNSSYSINECLFRVLIDRATNEVPIKYIWDKLSAAEKSRLISLAITESCNIDVTVYFLSQISENQLQVIFKSENDTVNTLLYLLDDFFWVECFLPTMYSIWHVITEDDYHTILYSIVFNINEYHRCAKKYYQYKTIFKEVWQCAPKHVKQYVVEEENSNSSFQMFYKLFQKKNIDIINILLFDFNDAQKKTLMFSYQGTAICYLLITSNDWDLLEMFIQSTHISEEDVENLKETLVLKKGAEIIKHFTTIGHLDKVDTFLKWTFKSEEDIKEYKSKLAYEIIDEQHMDI